MRQLLFLVLLFAVASYLYVSGPFTVTGMVAAGSGQMVTSYSLPVVVDTTAPRINASQPTHLYNSFESNSSTCGKTSDAPCEFSCYGMDCRFKISADDGKGAGVKQVTIDCGNGAGAQVFNQAGASAFSYTCEHVGAFENKNEQPLSVTVEDWVGNKRSMYFKAKTEDCIFTYYLWIDDYVGWGCQDEMSKGGLNNPVARKVEMQARACGLDGEDHYIDDGVEYKVYSPAGDSSVTGGSIDGRDWDSWRAIEFTTPKALTKFMCNQNDEVFGSIDACKIKVYMTEYTPASMECYEYSEYYRQSDGSYKSKGGGGR